jgi:hypothetical protein
LQSIIKDPLVVMDFPIDNEKDKTAIVRALLERKAEVESTFANDEFLKLDLTHQELVGIKSTAKMVTNKGEMPIGDLPALNYVISHSEKYQKSRTLNMGNVSAIYQHHSM